MSEKNYKSSKQNCIKSAKLKWQRKREREKRWRERERERTGERESRGLVDGEREKGGESRESDWQDAWYSL